MLHRAAHRLILTLSLDRIYPSEINRFDCYYVHVHLRLGQRGKPSCFAFRLEHMNFTCVNLVQFEFEFALSHTHTNARLSENEGGVAAISKKLNARQKMG